MNTPSLLSIILLSVLVPLGVGCAPGRTPGTGDAIDRVAPPPRPEAAGTLSVIVAARPSTGPAPIPLLVDIEEGGRAYTGGTEFGDDEIRRFRDKTRLGYGSELLVRFDPKTARAADVLRFLRRLHELGIDDACCTVYVGGSSAGTGRRGGD